MKYLALSLFILFTTGCDFTPGNDNTRYSLFETSKSVVYLLDTAAGDAKIVYSPEGTLRLTVNEMYVSDDGNHYEYVGNGKLKILSIEEMADKVLEKAKRNKK